MSKKKKKFKAPVTSRKPETKNNKPSYATASSFAEATLDKTDGMAETNIEPTSGLITSQDANLNANETGKIAAEPTNQREEKTDETTVVKREIRKIFFLLVFFVSIIVSLYFADQKFNLVQKIVDWAIKIYN